MREKERKEKNQCFYKSELREMAKGKRLCKKAKSHFKRKPYSKGGILL